MHTGQVLVLYMYTGNIQFTLQQASSEADRLLWYWRAKLNHSHFHTDRVITTGPTHYHGQVINLRIKPFGY